MSSDGKANTNGNGNGNRRRRPPNKKPQQQQGGANPATGHTPTTNNTTTPRPTNTPKNPGDPSRATQGGRGSNQGGRGSNQGGRGNNQGGRGRENNQGGRGGRGRGRGPNSGSNNNSNYNSYQSTQQPNGSRSAFQTNTRQTSTTSSASSSKQPKPPALLNGDKGAETHTVGEANRIGLTKLLMDLREHSEQERLELPPTLTNTERKFVHQLAGQLGLVSKSTGKGEDRRICVSKRKQQGNKAAGAGEEQDEIPVLRIGPRGSQALKEHLQRYPATHYEELESRETGASLVEALTQHDDGGDTDAAVVRTLQQLGLGSVQEAPQVAKRSKHVNLERRKRYHAAAQEQKQSNNPEEYKNMQQLRFKLPAWSHQDEIVEIVAQNAVTIISGETGCGKSKLDTHGGAILE
jgi:hypothetical protein